MWLYLKNKSAYRGNFLQVAASWAHFRLLLLVLSRLRYTGVWAHVELSITSEIFLPSFGDFFFYLKCYLVLSQNQWFLVHCQYLKEMGVIPKHFTFSFFKHTGLRLSTQADSTSTIFVCLAFYLKIRISICLLKRGLCDNMSSTKIPTSY